MSEPTITCPNCKTEIRLTESLAAPLLAATRADYERRLSEKDAKSTRRRGLLGPLRAFRDSHGAWIRIRGAGQYRIPACCRLWIMTTIGLACIAESPCTGQPAPSAITPNTTNDTSLLQGFRRYRQGRCTLITDTEPELARYLLHSTDQSANAIYTLFANFISAPPPPEGHRVAPPFTPRTVNVIVFQHQAAYRLYLKRRLGDNDFDDSLGLAFTVPEEGITELCAWLGNRSIHEVRRTLQHELVHHIEQKYGIGHWPIAVSEGVAEVFGYRLNIGGRLYEEGRVALEPYIKIKRMISEKRYISCETLLALSSEDFHALMDRGIDVYTQAWSLVHFLAYAHNGLYERRFLDFLWRCHVGQPVETAWRDAWGTHDKSGLTDRWLEYWASVSITPIGVAPDAVAMLLEISSLDMCTVRGIVTNAIVARQGDLATVGLRFDIEHLSDDRAVLVLTAHNAPAKTAAANSPVRLLIESKAAGELPEISLLGRLPYEVKGFFVKTGDTVVGHYSINKSRR